MCVNTAAQRSRQSQMKRRVRLQKNVLSYNQSLYNDKYENTNI